MISRVRLSALALVFLATLATPGWNHASADEKSKPEVTKTLSPDKLFEVREAGDENNKIGLTSLHVRKTGRQLIDFASVYDLKGRAENTETLWRSDSRVFAFHYAFLTKGATVVYRKEGDTFNPLPLPALPPMRKVEGKAAPDADWDIRVDTVYPIKWQKGGVLILEEFRVYGTAGGPSDTSYRKITVAVPDKGPLSIKKVEVIEISMREEINR